MLLILQIRKIILTFVHNLPLLNVTHHLLLWHLAVKFWFPSYVIESENIYYSLWGHILN